MASRYSSVNFGGSAGGLSTVGFVLYNQDRTVKASRTTSGVGEVGTSTGIYSASINVPEDWDGFVLWDTGEATPGYALDERFGYVSKIQENEKWLRMLVNTFTNQSGFDPFVREQFGLLDEKFLELKKSLLQDEAKGEILLKLNEVMIVASRPFPIPEAVSISQVQNVVTFSENKVLESISSVTSNLGDKIEEKLKAGHSELEKIVHENLNTSALSQSTEENKKMREAYGQLLGSIKTAFETSSLNIIESVKETTGTYTYSLKEADKTYKDYLKSISDLNATFKLSGLEKYAAALDRMSNTDLKEQINLLLNLNRDTASLLGALAPIKQGLKDILSRNIEKSKNMKDIREEFQSMFSKLEILTDAFDNRVNQEKKAKMLPFFLMAGGR